MFSFQKIAHWNVQSKINFENPHNFQWNISFAEQWTVCISKLMYCIIRTVDLELYRNIPVEKEYEVEEKEMRMNENPGISIEMQLSKLRFNFDDQTKH